MKFTQEKRICLQCQNSFWVKLCRIKKGKGNYCSHSCSASHKATNPEYIKLQSEKKIGKYIREKNGNWISDRTKLAPTRGKDTPEYRNWSFEVKKRDGFKCVINNKDCAGNLVSHHILMWAYFPELRYDINNGVCLCQYHHPLKHSEVERLSPFFQEIIINKTTNEL